MLKQITSTNNDLEHWRIHAPPILQLLTHSRLERRCEMFPDVISEIFVLAENMCIQGRLLLTRINFIPSADM